ncbi:MAG: exonuclease domain-containing protein [Bacteroidota bacterium]
MYAIIDIETTGGNPYRDKITEIAIFVHNGERVVDQFHSLVNPERKIPPFISRMTGISDEMVAGAPKFYEIARQLVRITENMIFVAHNASFDYNFIKSEFKSLGYHFQRECLCTVKLSRKTFPGKTSYSLGKLCHELEIDIENRHRASGDALATVKLFERILSRQEKGFFLDTLGMDFNNNLMNPAINRQLIEKIPQKTGVYYFLDEHSRIIYIGKSKDIRKRVITHLTQVKSKKSLDMMSKITDISWDITGSELLALLKESQEIKDHKPLFNRARQRCLYQYGLFSFTDNAGYLCLKLDKNSGNQPPVTSFATLEKGKDFLFMITEKFNLCQNLTGLYATTSACFQYAVEKCKGACIGKESAADYNERVEKALEFAGFMKDNLIVLDHGRTPSESGFIMIERGKYLGYGYIDRNESIENPEQFKNYLIPAEDNRDARQIINGFLRNKRTGKRITY